MTPPVPRLLYCHCRYAQVVPAAVKTAVLQRLCETDQPFEAVPDLCELAARRDPQLALLADPAAGPIRIAACFPRAVKWLFASAGAPLPTHATQVVNMRTDTADEAIAALLASEFTPNLPAGKPSAADAPSAPPNAPT